MQSDLSHATKPIFRLELHLVQSSKKHEMLQIAKGSANVYDALDFPDVNAFLIIFIMKSFDCA
jgi:hypothetical protein